MRKGQKQTEESKARMKTTKAIRRVERLRNTAVNSDELMKEIPHE